MTDPTFEARLQSDLGRYADGGVRPIDAHAIAMTMLGAAPSRGSGRFGLRWPERSRPTTRLALIGLLALLAIAVAITVVVVGQRSKYPNELTIRPDPSTPVTDSSDAPAPALPRLAYIEDGNVFLAGIDGSDSIKVIDDAGVTFSDLRWLTDGRHVAVEGAGSIAIVDLTTGESRRLDVGAGPFAWRADANDVAAIRSGVGGAPVALVITDVLTGASHELRIPKGLSSLGWAADGTALGGTVGRDIVRIDPVSGDRSVVATAVGDPEHVAWTSDLDRVAYVVHPEIPCEMTTKTCDSVADVYVADLTAGPTAASTRIAGPLALSRLNGDNTTTVYGPPPDPAFSPDGRWVAYRTAAGIALVHPDGDGRRDLLSVPVDGFDWRDDSEGIYAIASGTTDAFAPGELLSVDLAGGMPRSLGLVGLSQVAPLEAPPSDGQAWEPATPRATPNGAAVPSSAPAPTTVPPVPVPRSHHLVVVEGGKGRCGSQIRVIDVVTGAPHRPTEDCSARVSISSDGRRALVGGGYYVDSGDGLEPRGDPEAFRVIDLLTDSAENVDSLGLDQFRWSPGGRWAARLGQVSSADRFDWVDIPTNRDLTWSPQDNYLAIQSDAGLMIGHADGRDLEPVPSIPSVWSWSADERRIGFVRDGDAWVANRDGTGVQNITRFDFGGAGGIALSPDGESAAVTQGAIVWLIRVGDRSRTSVDLPPLAVDRYVAVSWAPSGGWLAITVESGDHRGDARTRFLAADGSPIADVEGGQLAWSPDGQHATVWLSPSDLDPASTTGKEPRARGRLSLVDRAGHVRAVDDAWGAVWAPDSSQFVVRTGKERTPGIDVLDGDGPSRRAVIDGTRSIDDIVWVPN